MKTTTTTIVGRASTFAKYGAAIAFAGMFGMLASVPKADAFVCGRGAYRAGCISSHGAFGIGRSGVVAVGRHGGVYAYQRGSSCYWFNSQRYCR